jgi:hypothetical protein
MRALPNKRHSDILLNLCSDLGFVDPLRSLYPNLKVFSYLPSDVRKLNRSRIDFFLVNKSLLPNITDTYVHPNLQSKMFDHKAIHLTFVPTRPPGTTRPSISHKILCDPDLDLVVGLAVADTYLASTSVLTPNVKNALSISIGSAMDALRKSGPSDFHLTPGDRSEADSIQRAGVIAGIRETLENFPLNQLQTGPLTSINDVNPDDNFMEGLINNVRNHVISHQTFALKESKKNRSNLVKRLKILHLDPANNLDEINELETFLNSSIDAELRHELDKLSGFEVVNSEKITPYFLRLAKGSKVEAKMADIKDHNGQPFDSQEDMKEYVLNFYANIYRKDVDEPADLSNCIENFLGPDICAHPLVTASKLSPILVARLEAPISLHELDISVEQANKSASGGDGMSNCFIKKYWKFFRIPLHRYLQCVLLKGTLTPTFRSGTLRLIPKKGDTSKITNWRPISLLSCMYKILSRALNNRLKTTRDTIFSRAQKGFTNSRFIQEVLINVCETIGFANFHSIPGCLVAIDQAKAFDTIGNKYMLEAYKFFGFGESMINLLTVLGSNRTASISFDDGSESAPFDLERGRTQGNGPSPCEYNIGQQVLLFKIELCPEIASVFNHLQVPRTVLSLPDVPHPGVVEAIR